MKIPEKVKVGFLDYAVEKVPEAFCNGNSAVDGTENCANALIRVAENGNLLVHHRTLTHGFTKYRRNHNFFTDNIEVADNYTNEKGIYKQYLNKKNNVVIYNKKNGASQVRLGSLVPSLLNDAPFFTDSIFENGKMSIYHLIFLTKSRLSKIGLPK